METKIKNYQINMDQNAHAQLKYRARQLGLRIGDLVENLLSSLELRLSRAKEICEYVGDTDVAETTIIKAILRSDELGMSEEELYHELKSNETLIELSKPPVWIPEIKFKE